MINPVIEYYFKKLNGIIFLLTLLFLWEFQNFYLLFFYITFCLSILVGTEEEDDETENPIETEDLIEQVKMYGDSYTEIILDPEFLDFYEELDEHNNENDLPVELNLYSNTEFTKWERKNFFCIIEKNNTFLYKSEINDMYNYIFNKKCNIFIGFSYLDLNLSNYYGIVKKEIKKKSKYLNKYKNTINIFIDTFMDYGLHVESLSNFMFFQKYDFLDIYKAEKKSIFFEKDLLSLQKKYNCDIDILKELLDIREYKSINSEFIFYDINKKIKSKKNKNIKVYSYNKSNSYLNLSYLNLPYLISQTK